MTLLKRTKFVVLAVLDGWGIAPPGPGNAVSLAKTPNMDRLWASYPHTQLKASGEAVGLPRGDAGNTETGHLNLGAGRIVYQDLERINRAIADGSFFNNRVFLDAFEHVKNNNSNLHLMGLIGAGGVHSNLDHLIALIQLAKKQNISKVFLHLFTDGRDSPPTASLTYINQLRQVTKREGLGTIASIMGRYWAMDRDRRWDRTAKAYFAMTAGQGQYVKTPEEAIEISYNQGKTDEFIEPSLISDSEGNPISTIQDNDACIFFNFRIDRPRQLTSAFLVKDWRQENMALEFDPYLEKYEKTHIPSKVADHQKLFDRGEPLRNLYFATMTEYSKSLVEAGAKVALPPEKVETTLGQVISDANLRQLKMAESEKERFVTFYFNGQYENPFPGEERLIIPSPAVSTYDAKPEMSAREQTEKLLEKLKDGNDHAFVLINFANPDMVGHTGNIGPAVKACEVVDECVGKIANFVSAYGGTLIVVADHGNVEEMINAHTGEIDTEHSTNTVPFIVVSKEFLGKSITLPAGILGDVAPTILGLLGVQKSKNMTGRNLLEEIFK
ncbi:2,3-bisphosphoglycerate-independent phosphoglycerate mutase [Patescibacteria group bacterium]|nr:2,3-bisphosphoglycerate-independent phosphoglycerate mutase [Patescibacteria group bacterium]MBU0777269.1 2,3-bisphosphoglycerate-independent phosphoglycerate mutase [Patescibacteria group bacterium]MBU0845715.1 2,3-bisphosphoglycerate-independent phosphoglycerate mutase [Patescibacteria group bacterium]MBU0923054.1 2,3-bisphosphoglycerate-independent phosphoglycerate mutase [Patescibacteria group bacterium]MBU1066605.1 2,3-bisphosphoglycerate-independent phosphoglycerate mutase [Patescibact